jgi:ribosomal-protein-alanine N-acetyltransferase
MEFGRFPRRPVAIPLPRCTVRSWTLDDVDDLVVAANNRNVWANLRDAFPHPYGPEHAHAFIASAMTLEPETRWAIDVDGVAVGSIAIVLQDDIERVSAELGYFLAEPFWGKGVMSDAVRAVTLHAVEAFGLTRVFAVPFAENAASARVLEKAGYTLEGVMRRSAIKAGVIRDQLLYAYVAS